jgi:hypothetical protein
MEEKAESRKQKAESGDDNWDREAAHRLGIIK